MGRDTSGVPVKCYRCGRTIVHSDHVEHIIGNVVWHICDECRRR